MTGNRQKKRYPRTEVANTSDDLCNKTTPINKRPRDVICARQNTSAQNLQLLPTVWTAPMQP